MKATKILVGMPGTSIQNKTGSWRTFYPVIDDEKCRACGLCAINCPEGCVLVEENTGQGEKKKYSFDPDFCKGCGLCAAICPAKAIEMKEEEK
jgi:pyruvate ferredoxin oxidoreductase delta subunit